jgi:hypothetical protein
MLIASDESSAETRFLTGSERSKTVSVADGGGSGRADPSRGDGGSGAAERRKGRGSGEGCADRSGKDMEGMDEVAEGTFSHFCEPSASVVSRRSRRGSEEPGGWLGHKDDR